MSPCDAQQGLKTGDEAPVLEPHSDPPQENRGCAVLQLRLRRRQSPTTFSKETEAEWVVTIGIPEAHLSPGNDCGGTWRCWCESLGTRLASPNGFQYAVNWYQCLLPNDSGARLCPALPSGSTRTGLECVGDQNRVLEWTHHRGGNTTTQVSFLIPKIPHSLWRRRSVPSRR